MAATVTGTSADDDLCCRMYEKAKKFGPVDMERSALESIIRKTPSILAAKSFLNLSNEAVCGILNDGSLRVKNELDVFKVVLRMGHFKCTLNEVEGTPDNLRMVLREIIPLIRFPLMEEAEFQDFVAPSGILDNSQLDQMNKWFQHKKHNTPAPYGLQFSTIPRNFVRCEDGNFCESTARFASELKTLEDFSSSGIYSGNINVVVLESLLCEIQKMMMKMAGEIMLTQKDLSTKTGYLEYLLDKTQKDANGRMDTINADLQGTKSQLVSTDSDLQNTKSTLNETRSDLYRTQQLLQENTAALQGNIDVLEKNSRNLLDETRGQLQRDLQSESQRTIENFQDLRKDLRQTESNLKGSDEDLLKKLEDTQRQFKSDLDQKSADLQTNIINLDKTTNEQFKETKNDLNQKIQTESEKTAENFHGLRKDLRQTEQNLRENDEFLEKKLEDTKRQLKNELEEKSGNLQSNINNLDKLNKEQLKETKNDLNKKIQTECDKTSENFNGVRKDLRQLEQTLRDCDDYLEKKLEAMITDNHMEQKGEICNTREKLQETKNELEKTKKDLRDTKSALQKTTADLSQTKIKLDDTRSELNATKSSLDDTKTELVLTREDLANTKAELEATKSELEQTKKELEKHQENQECRNLNIEGSLEKTQTILDETKQRLEGTTASTETRLEELNAKANDFREKVGKIKVKLRDYATEIEEIKIETPVPCGYIYIQFAKQPDPNELWPLLDWMEVTDEYAGLFFRALGGSSASFDVIQKQEIPRISTITTSAVKLQQQVIQTEIPEVKGSTSPHYLFTGSAAKCSPDFWGMQFHVSGTEVRPRNTAIRIWKRILHN